MNVFTLEDLGQERIRALLDRAREMVPHLESRTIPPFGPQRETKGGQASVPIELFELMLEHTLRTAGSFASAAKSIGCHYRQTLGLDQTSIPKGETFACTIRMLAVQQAADMLVMRTTWEGAPRFAAEIIAGLEAEIGRPFHVPVINGGDGSHGHPTQGLLDLMHLREKLGTLTDFTLGIVGEMSHSRTAFELLAAAGMFGFRVFLFCPPESLPPKNWLSGVDYSHSESLDGLENCDAINLIRLQKKRVPDVLAFERLLARFRITREVADQRLKPGAIFMHAQPIDQHDGIIELVPGLFQDPRFASIHQQAYWGHPMRMAVLAHCWETRDELAEIPKIPRIRPEVVESTPLPEKLDQVKRKRGQFFRPIEIGTMSDHLPVGTASVFLRLLKRIDTVQVGDHNMKATVEDVPSHREELGGGKDILILHGTFLPKHVMATIRLFAPSATFNVCRGQKFRKLRFPLPKQVAPGVLPCLNPDCITNNDPEGEARFRVIDRGEQPADLSCNYCDRVFSAEEILAKL